jgi:hypothetical protein
VLLALTALISPVAATALATPVAASTATQAGKTCSSKGLRFTRRSHRVTFSNKVTGLKATHTSCATARKVATVAAKALLRRNRVPAKVDGFRVRVKAPCAGCTPVWHVTATKASSKVRFTVLGGA